MYRRTATLVLSCVLLGACQYDPWADGFLTAQPAEKDVVGTYVIDGDSQELNIKLGMNHSTLPLDHSAQIILSADHKARFTRVPKIMPAKLHAR
jgi:hypothetical protein